MKKHDANSRRHSNDRSNNQGQRRSSHSTNNRTQSKKSDAKNAQIWVSHSSKTLTSHLPGINKGNNERNNWKNKHSNGPGQAGSQLKNRGNQDWPNNGKGPQQPRHSKPFLPKNNQRRSYKPRQEFENKNGPKRNTSQTAKASGQSLPSQEIDSFELFCAYHLGIGPNNSYKPSNINQVAQRFGVDPGTIRQATKEYGFDSESMLNKEFDLGLAQLDIQVAPEGISKVELARGIYEEFCNAPKIKRDWEKIIEEDKKENARVFSS